MTAAMEPEMDHAFGGAQNMGDGLGGAGGMPGAEAVRGAVDGKADLDLVEGPHLGRGRTLGIAAGDVLPLAVIAVHAFALADHAGGAVTATGADHGTEECAVVDQGLAGMGGTDGTGAAWRQSVGAGSFGCLGLYVPGSAGGDGYGGLMRPAAEQRLGEAWEGRVRHAGRRIEMELIRH